MDIAVFPLLASLLVAPPPVEYMVREPSHAARPTRGYTEFCQRERAECYVDISEDHVIVLDEATRETITRTNLRVNAEIRPKTDMEKWGVLDRWDYPDDGYGDCEDYQLLKRRLLVEAGIPRRAMRMAIVLLPDNQGHAVLLVNTNEGMLVLDNVVGDILTPEHTGYRFISRESFNGSYFVPYEVQPVALSQ